MLNRILVKSTKKELYFWGFLTLSILLGILGQKVVNSADMIAPNMQENERILRVAERVTQGRGIQVMGIAAGVDANSILPPDRNQTARVGDMVWGSVALGIIYIALLIELHEP